MNQAKRVAYRYMHRQAGVFEAPPAMLKTIGQWVSQVFAGHTLVQVKALLLWHGLQEDPTPTEQVAIVELKLLQRECEKYTKVGKTYRTRAQKDFAVDLKRWRYVSDIERQQDIASVERDWENIKVILNFKRYRRSVGEWRRGKKQIRIDARELNFLKKGWVEQFHHALSETLRTLRHELQHVGQDIITEALELPSEAGTPAEELGLAKPTRGRKPHPLREAEFYTRLADEIEQYVYHVRRHGNKREHFDDWIKDREFFKALRRKEPAKWRKAVEEFTKGLSDRGIDIPGKEH